MMWVWCPVRGRVLDGVSLVSGAGFVGDGVCAVVKQGGVQCAMGARERRSG